MSVNFSVPEHKHRIKPLTQILLNSLNHGIVDEASRFEIFLTFMWNYFQKCAFLCWKGILRLKVRSWAPEMHASNQVSRFWESIYKIWRATQHLGTHYPQLHPRGYGPTEETRAINETRRCHDYVCRRCKTLKIWWGACLWSQSMRKVSEIASATFGFCQKIYSWSRSGVERRWWNR